LDTFNLFSSFALGSFFSLITIINPPATLPLFSALSADMGTNEARHMASRAAFYCLCIVLVSLFAGSLILKAFGISYGALRVAGGLVVALLGHGMLYGDHIGRKDGGQGEQAPQEGTANGAQAPASTGSAGKYANAAFFPLALPGITGPGTIAVVIGISTEIRELSGWANEATAYAATAAAMIVVCTIEWLMLRSARRITARLGAGGIEVMTRLMGFLLICVGVQFIASGVKTLMAG
jgi:multiple antibiotic resistance protein